MLVWLCAAGVFLGRFPAGAAEQASIRVMTQNLDSGTDIKYLANAATFWDIIVGIDKTAVEVALSGFPARAARIADEIAAEQPHIIGLQEVTIWSTGPAFQPANDVFADQLQLLLDALKARNVHYTVAAVNDLTDITAPVLLPGKSFSLRLFDRDAMLIRSDLPAPANVQKHRFVSEYTLPGLNVPVLRGWISADVTIGGKTFRALSTHLESDSADIQVAQGQELIQAMSGTGLPIALLGDFNCNAEAGPEHYATVADIVAAGYGDAWHTLYPSPAGYTWPLHGEDPYTPLATPNERIDLVFTRNLRPLAARRIGNRLADRTSTGLWPSDHAGVVVDLALPN